MWWRKLVFSICLSTIICAFVLSNAYADEKKVKIAFDTDSICCILNYYRMVEELEKLSGVTTASFNERKRYFIVYYEQGKVKVQAIIQRLSKVTDVPEQFILYEDME